MPTIKPAIAYFAVVFAAGFVLGTIRTLWVAPALGARTAELAEAPAMVAVSFFTARWIIRRFRVPSVSSRRLSIGVVALAFMLLAEFALVRWVRGVSVRDYLATRDPVSGAAYYVALLVFASLPLLVGRPRQR